MEVYVTGAAFAGFLRTLEEGEGDAEGLMFGTRMEHSFEQISDSSVSSRRRIVIVCIHSFAYSHAKCSFYDGLGHVSHTRVEDIAKCHNKDFASIVGWFSFRRNSRHILSIRERAVHCSFLQLIDHIPCDSFLTALLTPDINMNYSVHTHHSTLYRTQLGILEPVALKFANLHSTSSVAYRKLPGYLTGSDQLERIASSRREVLIGKEDGTLPIVSLYNETTKSLEKMNLELVRSSEEVHELALAVKELEGKLESKEKEKNLLEEERQKRLEKAKVMGLLPPNGDSDNGSGPLISETQSIVEEFDPL